MGEFASLELQTDSEIVMEALGQLGIEERVIQELRRLDDEKREVRMEAVKTLARLVQNGNQHAITAVCARLEDKDSDARRVAVGAFAQLARKGDQHISTATSPH